MIVGNCSYVWMIRHVRALTHAKMIDAWEERYVRLQVRVEVSRQIMGNGRLRAVAVLRR